jgi:hypothetical protein
VLVLKVIINIKKNKMKKVFGFLAIATLGLVACGTAEDAAKKVDTAATEVKATVDTAMKAVDTAMKAVDTAAHKMDTAVKAAH